jgi:hypothetical protein
VRTYGEAAVITGRSTIEAKVKGQEVCGAYRFTDVWAQHGYIHRAHSYACLFASHVSRQIKLSKTLIGRENRVPFEVPRSKTFPVQKCS